MVTWTKLSDDYGDDCWTLSDAAYRLDTDGLVWSNRKLLDLRIPKGDLPRASPRAEVVAELVDAGYWADDGDSYVIRHHGTYQRTREEVLHQQEVNSRNGAKGGRPPKAGRERWPTETDSLTDSLSDSKSESETERDGTGLASREGELAGTSPGAHANDNGAARCIDCGTPNPYMAIAGRCRTCQTAWLRLRRHERSTT